MDKNTSWRWTRESRINHFFPTKHLGRCKISGTSLGESRHRRLRFCFVSGHRVERSPEQTLPLLQEVSPQTGEHIPNTSMRLNYKHIKIGTDQNRCCWWVVVLHGFPIHFHHGSDVDVFFSSPRCWLKESPKDKVCKVFGKVTFCKGWSKQVPRERILMELSDGAA